MLRTATGLVLIDAVVTENGKPVTGLQAAQFKVLENGKPQNIRVFQAQEYAPPEPGAAAVARRNLPPGVFTNFAPPVNRPPTILLLDLLNTPLADQNRAKQDVLKYLKTVQQDQQVCIYLLANHATLVQDFTSDPRILTAAIDRIIAQPAALASDEDSGRPSPSADGAYFAEVPRVAQAIQDAFAFSETERRRMGMLNTFAALRQIAAHAAAYPGRKNLLWLSGFFPLSYDPANGPSYTRAVEYYGDVLVRTAALLAADQIAVYPIDARGLVALPRNDLANAWTTRTSGAQTTQAERVANDPFRSASQPDSHLAMEQVAEETGGRAYYNRNEIDRAIGLSVADGSNYYTLGYYPDSKEWDGKYRKIEVKVDRKGAKVRARKGYFAYDPARLVQAAQEVSKREFVEAMSFGSSDVSTVTFAVRVTPSAGAPLRVDYGVNPHTLTFVAKGDGGQAASVDFVVQAFTPAGKLVNNVAETYNVAVKPKVFSQLMAGRFEFSQNLQLAPGKYVLKIGVRDNRSGLLGTVTGTAEIPARSGN
ncbi:MAG TPA: VWA domain-containing protein [Terriglobales bacterium]|nr:VWA domain-containing protein [Terriglobales bacterium]